MTATTIPAFSGLNADAGSTEWRDSIGGRDSPPAGITCVVCLVVFGAFYAATDGVLRLRVRD